MSIVLVTPYDRVSHFKDLVFCSKSICFSTLLLTDDVGREGEDGMSQFVLALFNRESSVLLKIVDW